MKKLIPLATLCFILQGCVGVVVPKPRTNVINVPVVSTDPDVPDGVRERDSSKTINARVETSECTSEWLRTYWGDPKYIRHIPAISDEIWTYKSRPVWAGVVPFVVIPIPLILPVTREKVCFRLHDGRVVSASVTKPWVVGGTFGFIPNPEGGGSFGAWNWEDSVK